MEALVNRYKETCKSQVCFGLRHCFANDVSNKMSVFSVFRYHFCWEHHRITILMEASSHAATSQPGSSVRRPKSKATKGLSAKDNLLQKAEEEQQDLVQNYTFNHQWQVRERQRDFDAKMARIERLGRSCGSYLTDQRALGLAQNLIDMVDKLKARWHLFGIIKTDFASLIDRPLSPLDERLLKESDSNTMVTILCQSFQMLSGCQIMEASIRFGF